jgi:hypothetical protein
MIWLRSEQPGAEHSVLKANNNPGKRFGKRRWKSSGLLTGYGINTTLVGAPTGAGMKINLKSALGEKEPQEKFPN